MLLMFYIKNENKANKEKIQNLKFDPFSRPARLFRQQYFATALLEE